MCKLQYQYLSFTVHQDNPIKTTSHQENLASVVCGHSCVQVHNHHHHHCNVCSASWSRGTRVSHESSGSGIPSPASADPVPAGSDPVLAGHAVVSAG